MKTRLYHLGLIKDKVNKTWILQVRKCVDDLSCELFAYYSTRLTTIKNLKANKSLVLKEINKGYKTDYKKILIDT